MSSPLARFAFVDSVHAAEVLHVTQDAVLDWIDAGKLKAYGGKPTNPFLRSSDVAALASELGVSDDEPPKRSKSASAKVQQRVTADARWSDVSIDEIRDWARRADSARRQAARTAALTARQRLDDLLSILEELSAG
ncbi:MAG TPA: hypothetical protein DEV93_07185 [Chloroflexi bacterium]|nr:hypothetical protein [Chloroflexota bacterium]